MMSSLTAKENRRRSPVTRTAAAKKAKKVSAARKKVTASPKSKKLSVSRADKKARPPAKSAQTKKSAAKKVAARKQKPLRSATQKKRPAIKRGKVRLPDARVAAGQPKVVLEPKPLPSPKALAAIRSFEHALKLFNRQDFAAAKVSFEQLIANHSDQTDIAAPVRTYLAICEQKMVRTSAKNRNPDALYNQGVFEFNRGNVGAAIEIFEKALKSEPRADHLLYSLAAAYARQGQDAKSVDALRKAIAVNPVHRSHARRDPDFTPLRTNQEFLRISGLDLEYSE
jgi:tetratricopeptide (TPR) repeat protein